ncbi:NACHT domain-containing protein [Halomonas sp. AOP22-C1-8]|uniref:NACHT domain-containing protein n=1 Tax=Halomonas sp. AOP22-C1-8 TaxID=3457717 RepID=UPI004034CBED
MSSSYDLSQLDNHSFESMVNYLALRVLGNGVTGFAAGADGGRDGYLEGAAPYPTTKDSWSGVWYIQSKFHKPNLSKNQQKWLYEQVRNEIDLFHKRGRTIPDVWIIATNIEPTAVKDTGSYDRIKRLIHSELSSEIKFDIWGGRKILDFLGKDPDVAKHYGHFLTPGNVLSSLYESINDKYTQAKAIIEHLIVNQFNEQAYTKLEQAGSSSDARPKIHQLFVDLPFTVASSQYESFLDTLATSATCNHKISCWSSESVRGRDYGKALKRSRVYILKGGPGQGKSTLGQFYSQIQRASFILNEGGPNVLPAVVETANELRGVAERLGLWTNVPRIPVQVELKEFATWYGGRRDKESKGILSYLAERIAAKTEQQVLSGTLKRAIGTKSWFFNFDGLDEVPNDVKDNIADEIIKFTDEILPSVDSDALVLCTTRPQGYSGQFEKLDASTAVLSQLPVNIALLCATAVVRFGRTESEGDYSVETLSNAMHSEQVRELMTTPLQSHIMAVVVRDGGRPPEKRWELFENFYRVMKKRESQKNFKDPRINNLLREDKLLKAIHARLGIALHAKAEISIGAEATLEKKEFEKLSRETVTMLSDANIDETLSALMEATTERLVFVNTPDNSDYVRFDIRQLQEFFAGEFIYTDVTAITMRDRIDVICADAHWREVMHFLLSSLVVNGRISELAMSADVLSSTDNWEGCHFKQIFRKRLAIGAILSLRLITEGVLEQDRRVRQNFKSVLIPLYGTLDSGLIDLMANVSHTNTKIWLQSCMIEYLFEASEEEQVGAAIVLTKSLGEDSDQLARVLNRILKSSSGYINAILKINKRNVPRFSRSEEKNDEVQEWFINGLISILNENKVRVGLDYSLLLGVLIDNQKTSLQCSEFFKLSEVEKLILSLFIKNFPDKEKHVITPRWKYKGIEFEIFKDNWQSGSIPPLIDFEIGSTSELSPFFQYCAATINLAKTKSYEDFQNYCSFSTWILGFEKLAPSYICAMLPLDSMRHQDLELIKKLSFLDKSSYEKFTKTGKLNGRNIRPYTDMVAINGDFTKASWKAVCRDFPYLAASVLIHGQTHGDLNFLGSLESSDLIEHAFSQPEAYAPHILHWGNLFRLAGSREQELREIFLEKLSETQVEGLVFQRFEVEISPFHIDLIREKRLLPLFASALVSISNSINEFSKFGKREYNNDIQTDPFSIFGINSSDLFDIFSNPKEEKLFRQSSISCFLVIGSARDGIAEEVFFRDNIDGIFFEILDLESPGWLALSMLKFAEKKLMPNNERSATLLGRLIDFYRDDYIMSHRMQVILSKWRERSSSPVSKKRCLNDWLKQED